MVFSPHALCQWDEAQEDKGAAMNRGGRQKAADVRAKLISPAEPAMCPCKLISGCLAMLPNNVDNSGL